MLGARGDHGYDPGGRIAHLNHTESSVRSALGYIGITEVHEAAVESDEFGGEQLAQSIRRAEQRVDALVDALLEPAEASMPMAASKATVALSASGEAL